MPIKELRIDRRDGPCSPRLIIRPLHAYPLPPILEWSQVDADGLKVLVALPVGPHPEF